MSLNARIVGGLVVAASLVVVTTFSGCKAIENESAAWSNKEFKDFKMHSPVVVAIEPAAGRAELEDEVVRILRSRGMQPVASHEFLASLQDFDVQAFKGYVSSHDNDSVLVLEPFAAEERAEAESTSVGQLYDGDLFEVMQTRWNPEEISADFGYSIGVWESSTWRAVWVGETDSSLTIEDGPDAQAEMITERVEGMRLN